MKPAEKSLPQAKTVDLGVAAWSAFLRTHATVVRRLERAVEAQTGLPLSWYDVLLELNAADERRLRMQPLAERVVLSRTRVSRLVDEMVGAGMVDKLPDPADRRATFAAITDRGRKALRTAAPVYLAGIEEHFSSHLRRKQLETIRDGLEQVLAAHHAAE
ncbi:MarR family transcriptional regulator [soil metagenome]|jgi:DNA-binding MarR family transcriptional regulator|nr:winged helix-turn-helix transcriptional regulator [Euzebyaceae bacterium]